MGLIFWNFMQSANHNMPPFTDLYNIKLLKTHSPIKSLGFSKSIFHKPRLKI